MHLSLDGTFENFSLDLLRRNEQNNSAKLVGAHVPIKISRHVGEQVVFRRFENDEKVKSVFFQIMNGVQFSSSMLCKTMILYQLYLVKRTIWLLFSHVARYFYGDVIFAELSLAS